MLKQAATILTRLRPSVSQEDSDHKLSWFAGVFTPTILTILGLIMYLRQGWVVGNAGLLGAFAIILLAHLITVCTGLAVSSIATNTKVGAGGAFAIITQSLGIEIGGSIGMPLYLAQGISAAFYILGFAEATLSVFPQASARLMWLVAPAAYLLAVGIAIVSARFAARIQYLILTITGLSLFSIFLGSFPILGQDGMMHSPTLWGDFASQGRDFWGTFAIFFPAVTGIMAGISMSGSLRNPRTAIPKGTIWAIGVGLIIYLALAYWMARIATPAELLTNSSILVEKAAWGEIVLAGMLGATFSSALGSLVAAPRVLQALAKQRLLPMSDTFVQTTDNGEPRKAAIATGIIGGITLIIALVLGGLDPLAELLSLFFLLTYFMLNMVVLIEQSLQMVSFRPTFSIPRLIPFVGMAGCLFVMFLINSVFTVAAIAVALAIYNVLARRFAAGKKSDARSGLFISLAEQAAKRAITLPAAPERAWKPSVLAPVTSSAELSGNYRFLQALTYPQGSVNALGISASEGNQQLAGIEKLSTAFAKAGIFSRYTFLESDDFADGVKKATQVLRSAFFRPNLLFLQMREESDLEQLQLLVDETAAYSMGIVLFSRHPINELGREHDINVWMSFQPENWQESLRLSNIDLALMLATQLRRNWKGRIQLCMAVADEAQQEQAEQFIAELSVLARLPKDTKRHIDVKPFMAALAEAPEADLSILGLPQKPNLYALQTIAATAGGSCIFVRDSGEESVLA